MFVARYSGVIANAQVSGGWMRLYIILPKVVIELLVYNICVKPAYRRAVYQEYSKWKKGGQDPRESKEQKNKDQFFKVQLNKLKLLEAKDKKEK